MEDNHNEMGQEFEISDIDTSQITLAHQKSLFNQLNTSHEDPATKEITEKPSQPNRYVFKFKDEKFETYGFGTLTNTVIYVTEKEIKRLNIDGIRRKMKKNGVSVRNQSLNEA